MTVMRGNYDKARLRKLDAEHHLHPFTNNKQNVENGGALSAGDREDRAGGRAADPG